MDHEEQIRQMFKNAERTEKSKSHWLVAAVISGLILLGGLAAFFN